MHEPPYYISPSRDRHLNSAQIVECLQKFRRHPHLENFSLLHVALIDCVDTQCKRLYVMTVSFGMASGPVRPTGLSKGVKMARSRKPAIEQEKKVERADGPISLSKLLSKKPLVSIATFWIVGDTPLIVHAWSEKAKREMLAKQVKAVKAAKEARDPMGDFVSSLYEMSDGVYGFPVTGIKNCILASAHKDRGIARSAVMSSLFLEAEMTRVRPALAGAICDMPLVRIWAGKPEPREDMVKIGSGLQKVASLAYRAQFTHWGIRLRAKFNPDILTPEALTFLIQESGIACGLGEWRNERRGVFGAFHLASAEEESEWERFASGKGALPIAENYRMAAE